MVFSPNFDPLRRMSRPLRGKALVEVIIIFVYLLFIIVLFTHNLLHEAINFIWLRNYADDSGAITKGCVVGFVLTLIASLVVIIIIPELKKTPRPPRPPRSGARRNNASGNANSNDGSANST
jgi:hypothetical protein